MNWGMPARPCVSPQVPVEGRVVNMDPKPIPSLPQGSPILSVPRLSPWPLNVHTYSHNHQVDAEARSLVGCVRNTD
jgi:hypothetical protein